MIMMGLENTDLITFVTKNLEMNKKNHLGKPVQGDLTQQVYRRVSESSGLTHSVDDTYFWSPYYPNFLTENHWESNPGDGWVYPSTYCPYFHANGFPQPPVQKAPQNLQEFEYFVVIDFEATCDKVQNPLPQEIIEFPSVIVNSSTGQQEGCFQIYVRPTHNKLLTEFCKNLTGIQQSQVDKGVSLTEALLAHDKWLEQKGVKYTDFAVVTWSDSDCRVMLESECRFKKISKPPYFNRWINLKIPFEEAFGGGRCNLKEAVQRAGLTWQGRAHCGLDDAKNTASLLTHIMSLGIKLSITSTLDENASSSRTGPAYPGTPYNNRNYGPYYPAIPKHRPLVFCYCGAVSKKKFYQAPGLERGSFFFSCGNATARGTGCRFFKWDTASDPAKARW